MGAQEGGGEASAHHFSFAIALACRSFRSRATIAFLSASSFAAWATRREVAFKALISFFL